MQSILSSTCSAAALDANVSGSDVPSATNVMAVTAVLRPTTHLVESLINHGQRCESSFGGNNQRECVKGVGNIG